MISPRPAEGLFAFAWRLYCTHGEFRGFADFAFFGGLTLLFLYPPSLPFFDLLRVDATAPPSTSQSTVPSSFKSVQGGTQRTGSPLPGTQFQPSGQLAFDNITFAGIKPDETAFATSAPSARERLERAVVAFRADDMPAARRELDAADPSDPNVMLMISLVLLATDKKQATIEQARALAEDAAQRGQRQAMTIAGVLAWQDFAWQWRDRRKSFDYLERAAKAGDPAGARIWAGLIARGVTGGLNYPEAAKYFKVAADRDSIARIELGVMYFLGLGVEQDQSLGEKMLTEVAEANGTGAVTAQFYLGAISIQRYLRGDIKDIGPIVKWYRLAAAAGDIEAGYQLAQVLLGPEAGAYADSKFAVRLVQANASRGHAPSQFVLAACYEYGLGVDQDLVRAYAYYLLARDGDSRGEIPNAPARLERLDKRLSDDQRTAARRLLATLRP